MSIKFETLQLRRGLADDWSDVNPVLGAGEPGFETDTLLLKIGDGTTHWNDLAYQGSSPSPSIQAQIDSKLYKTYSLALLGGTAAGRICVAQAGENLVFGDPCYIKSDGLLWKSDATDGTKMPCMFIALATISANNMGNFLSVNGEGAICKTGWTWTVGGTGGIIYVDKGGGLTQAGGNPNTYFTTTGNVVQAVGVAIAGNIVVVPAPVLVGVA